MVSYRSVPEIHFACHWDAKPARKPTQTNVGEKGVHIHISKTILTIVWRHSDPYLRYTLLV